jgi:hypothetical protein
MAALAARLRLVGLVQHLAAHPGMPAQLVPESTSQDSVLRVRDLDAARQHGVPECPGGGVARGPLDLEHRGRGTSARPAGRRGAGDLLPGSAR